MHGARLAGALAFLLFAPALALGQERTWEWQWGMHPMMFMWGAGGLVMLLMMLVFWGLVIAGLVLGVRWLAGQGRGAQVTRRWKSCVNATRAARSGGKSLKRENVISESDHGWCHSRSRLLLTFQPLEGLSLARSPNAEEASPWPTAS